MQDYYDTGAGPLIEMNSTYGLWSMLMSSMLYLERYTDRYIDKRYGKCTCKICEPCKGKALLISEIEIHKKIVIRNMDMLVKRDRNTIFNI